MSNKIFCFWFGDNMSEDRRRCFNSILTNSGSDVLMITDENLHEYEMTDYPFHKGFKYLSFTHKSDYLRSYFMYHYGGGYSDIKQCNFNWSYYFKILHESGAQFIGYSEIRSRDVGYLPAKEYYKQLAGMCQYIFKSKTSIGKQWLDETNKKMDSIYYELEQHPGTYHSRAITGGVQGEKNIFTDSKYPLRWVELLGEIFHKIQFENLGKYNLNFPYPTVGKHR